MYRWIYYYYHRDPSITNFSTSASSSRRRGILDSRAKYTFMRARLPRPSDPQSQLGKMPALCGNLFEMSVEGTRHERSQRPARRPEDKLARARAQYAAKRPGFVSSQKG